MATRLKKILFVIGFLCLNYVLGEDGLGTHDSYWNDISGGDSNYTHHHTNRDNHYLDFWWHELPEEALEAAATLGYDKHSWNDNLLLTCLDVQWEDLSQQQVAAASTHGWDLNSWNKRYEENQWVACNDWEHIYDWETIENIPTYYQDIEVYYSKEEGDVCLFLNDYMHTCASSRPHYHEVFVHYAARFLDEVKRVIYIGGGDALVLHEVLKYPSLELVVGLELDQQVTRTVFKSIGVQPHWNNEKVQWWYGDAAKSLTLLPREYYGTFDLVIVDLTTEVQQELKVNHELNVIEAATLLMHPGGVILRNEDDPYIPGDTSNYTYYSVDLMYHDVPLYCLQEVVLGSNTVDFLTAVPKDHNVETLYLKGVDDFQAHFDSWYNFGIESSQSTSAGCRLQHKSKSTVYNDNLESLGVLMVLEAENVTVPLDSATTAEPVITQALSKAGVFETAGMSFPISGSNEGFTLVSLVPDGYIVTRCFALLHYCSFDIQFWGAGIQKLDGVKAELINAVQSQYPSSYRMITGGMSGVQKEEMSRLGPPPAEELCKNQTDSDQSTTPRTKIRKERKAEDFERPRSSTLHTYNLTSPLAQWESQRQVGAQTVMQFEVGKVLDKDEMFSVLAQTSQMIAGSGSTLTRKQVSEEIEDGLVFVESWSEGTIVATWDGRTHVEFNLFLALDDIDVPSAVFDEAMGQNLAHWRLVSRDDFPRGIGSVVNFKTDTESPPVWAKE